MSNSDFFIDPSRAKAIKHIRDFITHPGQRRGGVLLLTGQRGSGKTRLVEEALKDKHNSNYTFFRACLGQNLTEKQRQQNCPPQHTKRILLPINVDPLFSHTINKQDSTTADNKVDPNQSSGKDQKLKDALALLHNVIFALTNAIDARGAPHRNGLTLSVWLGWLRLWFSQTALYQPQGIPNWISVFILSIATYMAAFSFSTWLIQQFQPIQLLHSAWHLLFYPIAVINAWLLLRWRDLRGLRRRGAQLYDLVHAQTMEKDVQLELQQQLSTNMKWQRAPLILLGLLFGGGSLFFAQTGKLQPEVVIALGAAGVVSFLFSIKQKSKQHAVFGVNNQNWMINLLRRYLFQLQRAGFEPVLVVDEIDKLSSAESSEEGSPPSELQRLAQSMSRFKQSLCAEFVWILIDNGRFIERVIYDRRNGMQGELSTLVQTEVFIEPLSYDQFKRYADAVLNRCTPLHDEQLASLWIKSRGIFFNIHRTYVDIQNGRKSFEKLNDVMGKEALLTQKAIDYLCEKHMVNMAPYLAQGSQQDDLSSLLKTSNWHRIQLLNGMLDIAQQLYDPRFRFIAPSWKDIEDRRIEHAPKDGSIGDNPMWFEHLGKMALLMLLDAVYQGHNGLEDIIEPIGNGIDLAQQKMNNLQPLRLIVK